MDHRHTIKHKTIKPLEDNIGENLGSLVFGHAILNITPKNDQ